MALVKTAFHRPPFWLKHSAPPKRTRTDFVHNCEDFEIVETSLGSDPDQRNYIVSNKKIEATGFKTSYTLDSGINELIKGYKMIKNNLYSNV